MRLSAYLSFSLSVRVSVLQFVCASVCVSVLQFVCASVRVSVLQFVFASVNMSSCILMLEFHALQMFYYSYSYDYVPLPDELLEKKTPKLTHFICHCERIGFSGDRTSFFHFNKYIFIFSGFGLYSWEIYPISFRPMIGLIDVTEPVLVTSDNKRFR